jgi:hypothetical protein
MTALLQAHYRALGRDLLKFASATGLTVDPEAVDADVYFMWTRMLWACNGKLDKEFGGERGFVLMLLNVCERQRAVHREAA